MKIILCPEVSMNLEAIINQVGHREFSGVGLCRIINGDISCYEILLLDVGSGGYSEISTKKLMKSLKDRSDKNNVRLWFHRHPIEGWSATDLDTIQHAPLGGIPEIVQWSASIVRTPTRWIGRVDNHLDKTHVVAEVEPNVNSQIMARARDLLAEYWNRVVRERGSEEVSCPPKFPDQKLLQTSFPVIEETNLPDLQGLVYEDDGDDSWESADDTQFIEKYIRGKNL